VQFRNQYTIAKSLNFPRIIQPLSLEPYHNSYALIMEDFGGVSLSTYLQLGIDASQPSKSLPSAEFLQIALQLTDTLHYLYQNRVIHKDIKPANILINPDTKQIKLTDFSISSLLPRETQEIQNLNILEGTLPYLSPEQTGRMNRGIDYRSDFYSLGVTFYELLTGKLPFISEDAMELVHCHLAKEPLPIHQIQPQIPLVLSAIVSKLMAKNAEDRYQSALGLKHDLEMCLAQLQTIGEIETFKLGERDISDRFIIPEKLYGRETEVATILQAFDRVSLGAREILLVAGFSGIGKTAVVNEVHKPIVRQRGYFIKGKYDQFNRNIPFSALIQAFQYLIKQLLSESDRQLQHWKKQILAALGENGQVIIDVIPELEQIIGKQPPAPELAGNAAQNRFNLLFQKFIQLFTKPEHPLVIFLDDLQWADSASLNVIQLLMAESETGYLLLIGAYRDNEVFAAHPLILTLDILIKNQVVINTIILQSLSQKSINCLVADTLNCIEEMAQPLTAMVAQKTQGNPFFATQFLKALYQERLITFDQKSGHWQCDIVRVRESVLTDDVVEFIALQLEKLPLATQDILKLAACIGNQFDLATLAIVSENSEVETAARLWRGLQEGFVLPQSDVYKFYVEQESLAVMPQKSQVATYRFLHDRVQQAAYSLIPDDRKVVTHRRIGQLLLENIAPQELEERIFEIVGYLNHGIDKIGASEEREYLARLNLMACYRAKSATAYGAGYEYAHKGLSLLGDRLWQEHYDLAVAFHEIAAEFAYLCGDWQGMDRFVEAVVANSHNLLERVKVYQIQIQAHASRNQLMEAVTIALGFLQQLGITFPENPTEVDIENSINAVEQLIVDREIEELLDLPQMSDPQKIAIVQTANSIIPATYLGNPRLFPLVVCLSVTLSIQYGNIPSSGYAYACYGLIISASASPNVITGVKFSQLSLKLVSKLEAKTANPEVLMIAGLFLFHRTSHIQETLGLLQTGYTSGLEVGNYEFAGYSGHGFCCNSFWCGQTLHTLAREARVYSLGLAQLNQLTTANYSRVYWQAVLNLLGMTENPVILSGEALEEEKFLSQWQAAKDFYGLFIFHTYKLMLCYLFGEIESAQQQANEGRKYILGATGTVNIPAFYFYDSLSALAAVDISSKNRAAVLQQVEDNQVSLGKWSHYAPMNYQHKVDLVSAEKYRVLGRNYEAGDWYDRAIAGAQVNDYIQEEALANELAAKFYLSWGKEKVAAGYMQEAYYCYARWGAKAKVVDLEKRYPQLLAPILQQPRAADSFKETLVRGTISSTKTSNSISEALDLATLFKAYQAISGEIELNKLLTTLVEIVIANAGANKCILLLKQEINLNLVALVEGGKSPRLLPSIPLESNHDVPISLVNTVKRTLKPLVLADARINHQFAGDSYIQKHQPKSILCSPILNQAQLIGVLYLENNLTIGAFTTERIEVLNLICAQAAISIENARLYQAAQQALNDLKQAQITIIQSEKMSALGNLVAGVAHEINNPVGFLTGNITPALNYINDLFGLLDLYQQTYPQPDAYIQEEIETIELDYIREDLPKLISSMWEGIKRIQDISISLRTFSRADAEHPINYNIHDGIDSTIMILKHRLKANDIRPEIQIIKQYSNLPQIECYAGQLNQVFMNILGNAIDALEEANQGRSFSEIKAHPNQIIINTELSKDRKKVLIRVRDNGIGISDEIKNKIFDHLFTTKGVGKGTGLGLAIAYQIVVEKHQGAIAVNSSPETGTEFIITLPLKML
ncbi:MAG TPA: AAA family ATPase, partial [Kamptonema sp.]|nr:AAA family ATPase [Kamptonema sp.]